MHKSIQDSSPQTFSLTRLVPADLLSVEDPCKKISWHKQNRDQNPSVVVLTTGAASQCATEQITGTSGA